MAAKLRVGLRIGIGLRRSLECRAFPVSQLSSICFLEAWLSPCFLCILNSESLYACCEGIVLLFSVLSNETSPNPKLNNDSNTERNPL